MKIDTQFIVAAPHRVVWEHLLRTEDVVECIPGAEINQKISDDEYEGQVVIKLGPLTLNLEGVAVINERDHEQMVLAISGKAKDRRGRGATDAKVTAQVHAESEQSTRVSLVSDLRVTGKIAQFGRGVMKDVSQRIAGDFARNLEARISAESAPRLPQSSAAERGGVARATPEPTTEIKSAKAIGGFGLVFGALLRAAGRGILRLFGRVKG